jgi:Carbonic anhydrases/acetyltransferases, isoleucine patch superfamily
MTEIPLAKQKTNSCRAAEKLRKWLDEGAEGRLILSRDDFIDQQFSLTHLLFSGPLKERLAQRWRSFCAYMGQFTPFCGWKNFWYRRAGVKIGPDAYIAPGVVLDLLFPQLITLEDEAVLGFGAMVMAHVYTPDRIVLARATIKKRGLVGGRAILAVADLGEESVLGANTFTMRSIGDGQTASGPPLICRDNKNRPPAGEGISDE